MININTFKNKNIFYQGKNVWEKNNPVNSKRKERLLKEEFVPMLERNGGNY